MRLCFIAFAFFFAVNVTAQDVKEYEPIQGEVHLLALCDEFGETKAECKCYFEEVKTIYSPADIALSGSVAKAFLSGQKPEAIASYLLLTRKVTISQVNQMYQLGDQHVDQVGKKCKDNKQTVTPAMKAKRDAMSRRLEKIAKRYRFLPASKKS